MPNEPGLVVKYARMWPREVFDCLVSKKGRSKILANDLEILNEPGVYVLYRADVPYYIGQAQKLRHRLWKHASRPGSRYFNFWNFFSAFVVKDAKKRTEIERILIAAMPTANSAKPTLVKEGYPKPVIKMVREIRRNQANPQKAR